jgi:predicted acyltransferase
MRGLTITAMILVNAQYSHDDSYHELLHADWNGLTFADTIFPAFLFLVGVSLTFSVAARLARGEGRRRIAVHVLRRSLLLFAIGLAIDYLRIPVHDFPYVGLQPHLQLTGVLQKIAACDLLASLVYLGAGLRGVVIAAVLFNVVHALLLYGYPVPGCGPGVLTVDCNFPGYLDELLLHGHRWNSTAFDPDGLGAILPATSSVLFGILAGHAIRGDASPRRRLARLLGGGIALIAAGALLAAWIPLNKQLWTSSFAVLTAGFAATGLAACIALVDWPPPARWYQALATFGRNAIAAYLASRVLANVMRVHAYGESLHDNVLAAICSPANASLLFAVLVVAAVYGTVLLLDRMGWRLKL